MNKYEHQSKSKTVKLGQVKKHFVLNRIAQAQRAILFGLTTGTSLVCAPYIYANPNAEVVSQQRYSTQSSQNNISTTPNQTQSEAVTLPKVVLTAQQVENYTAGQVEKTSNVGFLGNKKLLDTPFNTMSYTDKYVLDKQAKDITGVIATTDASVYTNNASGGWGENYYIRGYESRTNDMSMNGLFGITPFYRTSPEMFSRVEVLKGPSALLNGMPPAGTVGGTVNLVTKRADDQPLTRLTTTYMSDSQVGGHLDVGRRFGENNAFGVRANAMYRDGQGAIKEQNLEVGLFSLGLDWRGERARLSADFYTADDRVDGVNRGINLGKDIAVPRPPKNDVLINPVWSYVENKDRGVMVRGEFDLNDQVMAYATYGQSRTDYKYNGTISATLLDQLGNFTTTIGQLAFDVEKKSADVGLKASFDTGPVGHEWVTNATYYKHNQNDFGVRSVAEAPRTTNLYDPKWGSEVPFNVPPISHTELELSSVGVADTLSMMKDRLQLTLGARYQEVKSTNQSLLGAGSITEYKEDAITPAAAILFKANDQLSFYANYIEGLSKGDAAPLTAANYPTIFAPYKTKQTELGVKYDMGKFTNTLSLFQIKKPSSYTDPISNIFRSDGEQRNRGIEWSFFGTPIENLRLLGGASYIEPELTKLANKANEGNMATAVPKAQGKLGVEWDSEVATGTLTLTANATAVSKQYVNQENTLSIAGRTIFDVGARYKTAISNHPVTLRAGIHNVSNKAYWGTPQLSNLALGAPRTYMFSASYDF